MSFSKQSDHNAFAVPTSAPQWFIDNLQHPGESVVAPVAGGDIHFLAWNWEQPDLPTLLFVHGFAGHARWWSYLAPFFTDQYRVLAMDLPGMGDNTARSSYDDHCFAQAIIDVIRHYDLQQVTIVGHSFGGIQTIRALAMAPELFQHGIVVDSNVRLPPADKIRFIDGRESHARRPSQAACVERFRLTPPQPVADETLLRFIGFHSCSEDEQGWFWKFDPKLRNYAEINDASLLETVTTKVDCIYGEHSMFSADNLPARVLACFPNRGKLIMIPGAYHHLMVDQPLPFVDALKTLLNTKN